MQRQKIGNALAFVLRRRRKDCETKVKKPCFTRQGGGAPLAGLT
jgi:hypothetical protein